MAKERLKSPRARLFVALDLPQDVRAGVVDWQQTALADPALRIVRPEALHITLAWTLFALVSLHVAAAMKHTFLDRDGLLRRMVPGRT